MITAAQFQAAFTAFANTPTDSINFWITVAYEQLPCSLGVQLDYAAMLFVAHNLFLTTPTATGASPQAAGMVNNKAAGGLSVGYDTAATAIEGAGVWNASIYGQLLYPLLRGSVLGGTYVPAPRRAPWPFRVNRGFGGGIGF